MKKEILVSIIIPIYNSEQTLSRCLNSIISQSYTNLEILLINDGSTDNSLNICESFALNDNRIKIISKENGGVSLARQVGVDIAKGKYSIHVDSDDYICENMISDLCNKAEKENSDMIFFDYIRQVGEEKYYMKLNISSLEKICVLKSMITRKIAGSCWNKFVRHSLYKEYNIKFPESLGFGEDWYVNVLQVAAAEKIGYINNAYYYYVLNSTSIMSGLKKDDYTRRFSAIFSVVEILKEKSLVGVDFDVVIAESVLNLKVSAYKSGFFSIRELKEMYEEFNPYLFDVNIPFYHKILLYAIFNEKTPLLSMYNFALNFKKNKR